MEKRITKSEWLESNGFSQFEVTYIVLGNSYAIKDELKDNDFKYSGLLRWHAATADFKLPEGCSYHELKYSDYFVWDEEQGVSFLREGAREQLDLIFNPRVPSNSQWIGEIGDRFRDIPVTVKNIAGFDSAYGYKYVYTFEDDDENIYTWFTTLQQPITIGVRRLLTGTLKAHVEYKGARTNQLTRCKLS